MSDQSILRITRDIKQLQQGADLSLSVHVDDSDIRSVHALILGPPETPYQYGFFEFSIKFGSDYPTSPPSVKALTTNGGRCRFNPNLYASGKVCLSILGTWRGDSGEQWSSAQGLESVLISIQSLMSANPYENEPGYENADDQETMEKYASKIHHETLRISVIEPLERSLNIQPQTAFKNYNKDDIIPEGIPCFDPFEDFRKRRFLWYFESYMKTTEEAEKKTPGKVTFERTVFEGSGNTMDGHFNYPELKARLAQIQKALIKESKDWTVEGRAAQDQEEGIAVNLRRQHEQIIEYLKNKKNFTVDLNLSDDNPFLWDLTYFGRPMTQLEGGIFKMKIYLSPRFPEEQPRVFMDTPLFHHRVSKENFLSYIPSRTDEMRYHIEAIVDTLEEESPPYDPRRIVNLEATKMFWGSPDERKQYKRALRRSVERSVEESFA